MSFFLASSSPSSLRRASSRSSAGGQERAVADLADVELERILGRPGEASFSSPLPARRRRPARRAQPGPRRARASALRFRSFGLRLWSRQLGDWALSHEASIGLIARAALRRTTDKRDGARSRAGPMAIVVIVLCGIAGYSLSDSSRVDPTLATQILMAAISERGSDAAGYCYRGPGRRARDPQAALGREPAPRLDPRAGDTRDRPSSTSATTRRAIPSLEANNHPIRHGVGRRDPQRDHPQRRGDLRGVTASSAPRRG